MTKLGISGGQNRYFLKKLLKISVKKLVKSRKNGNFRWDFSVFWWFGGLYFIGGIVVGGGLAKIRGWESQVGKL